MEDDWDPFETGHGNRFHVGVSKKRGVYPPKWMVKTMVPNPMNKWDDLGVPLFLG